MITLVNGDIQNSAGLFVPNGSISFQLNVDAQVIASPNGFVSGQLVVVFQFDGDGNLIPPAQLYSNLELNPRTPTGLGTYYLVCCYDANGARINRVPMWWQFQNPANDVVDISTMTAYLVNV